MRRCNAPYKKKQQEVRVLAYVCGDEHMRKAYAEDKDIYAWIGSMVYKVPYEECKEFYPDGTTNPEGKKRRTSMKSVNEYCRFAA